MALLNFFVKKDVKQYKWEGRQAIVPLHKSRNYGTKSVSETGTLPTAGNQGYVDMKIPVQRTYGRIQLTAQVMKQSVGDKAAFASALETEQTRMVEDLARQRNRMLAGFGSGTLAVISGSTNNATQTLKNPGGVTGTTNPTRFVRPGMVIAITDSSGTFEAVKTVSSVDDTNGTVTFDSALNGTDGWLLSLGVVGSTESSYNLEPMGILGIVDGTTYVSSLFNVDRSNAANAFFKSQVLSSVGNISPDLLQRAIDNTQERSGKVIDGLLCHHSVRRELVKLSEADRRYNIDGAGPQNFDTGTKAGVFDKDLTFGGKPIEVDKDFAYGTLVGYKKANLFWIPLVEGEWADEDGKILLRVANSDSYEGRYRIMDNFFSDRGNAHFRADGINATVSNSVFAD